MALDIRQLLVSIALLLIVFNQQVVRGQENAQTRVPNSLIECYENPEIYERDNRLPATISTLIELIRKVEDSGGYLRDIKDVAIGLLHRFRMDGIEHANENIRSNVLPYSPKGYQFSKHRLLLSRLIPNTQNAFPNDTLSLVERCTLHFLLSSSIDSRVRGDENMRCGQLAQFRSERVSHSNEFGRRKRSAYVHRNNYLCDIEMMSDMSDPTQCQRYKKKTRSRQYQPKTTTMHPYENDDYGGYGDGEDDEAEYPEPEFPYDSNSGRSLVDIASNAISQCPVENGVMRTKWGAVAAGPLIAGIAAGLVQQNVGTYDLLKLTRNYNTMPRQRQQPPPNGRWNNNRQQQPLRVDNRWAATLAGDLSEVTLLQGPMTKEISVGAAGAWNSTSNPHWYFLSQRERFEMTDAEIRGGIDGLILGMNIADWQGQISQLRLSQVLDMYYSNRGILSPKFRSCNRRELFSEYVKPDQLQMQTIAFSTVLEREMTLEWTLTNENIEQFSGGSTGSLTRYVSNGLNDVSCDVTSIGGDIRVNSDLHIFLETTWQYNEIQPNLMALLQDPDINKYNSRVTLYNAQDCSVMVNTTTSVSDIANNWNQTSHTMKPSGLNLAAIVKQIREINAQMLNDERSKNQGGGRSFVTLVIPQLTGVSDSDSNYVAEQIDHIYETVPDLTLLFWSGGAPGRFARYVVNQQRDLFQLTAFGLTGDGSQQINANVLPVVQRIQSVPRRITNPRCNSDWQESEAGSNTLDQYVEPSGVNFYRLHPNYFFRSSGIVRIQGRQQTQIRVCSSRTVELPRFSNSTLNDNVNCRTLTNTESFDIDLNNACYDYYYIHECPPYYISVEAVPSATPNNYQCNDANCRFFDEIKFIINTENLGCYSRTSKTVFQSIVLVFSLGLVVFQKLALF